MFVVKLRSELEVKYKEEYGAEYETKITEITEEFTSSVEKHVEEKTKDPAFDQMITPPSSKYSRFRIRIGFSLLWLLIIL